MWDYFLVIAGFLLVIATGYFSHFRPGKFGPNILFGFLIVGAFLTSFQAVRSILSEQKIDSNITGGNNKPVIGIMTNIQANRDWDPISKTHSEVMRFNQKVEFVVTNDKRYPLKDVVISIKDKYRKPKEIGAIEYVPYNLKEMSFNSNEINSYFPVRLGTLPPKTHKLFYISLPPENLGTDVLDYEIAVEWSNGYYYLDIGISEKDGSIIRQDYYTQEGKVDPEKYFDRKILTTSK